MNDTSLEDLMDFERKKIVKVVHFLDSFGIFHRLGAPLWQELLTENLDEASEVGIACQANVLLREVNTSFNLICNTCQDRERHGLDNAGCY